MIGPRARVLPSFAGLLVAYGGTALLVSPAAQRFASSLPSYAALWFGITGLWTLCAAVLAIVLCWERAPLASLWLRPLRWDSFAWAGVLVVAGVFVLFPVTELVRKAAGLPGYASGMASVMAQPVWLRAAGVLTAGIVEELLFRGYAVTRLALLTGRLWVAVPLAMLLFAALHLPAWGAGPALAFFLAGLPVTLFFVWRRDLTTMIVAHVSIDAWGLIVAPVFVSWWN